MECGSLILSIRLLLLLFTAAFLDTAKASYTTGKWLSADTKCFFFSRYVSTAPWDYQNHVCDNAYLPSKLAEPESDADMSFLEKAGNAVDGASRTRWAIGVMVNRRSGSLYYVSGMRHSFLNDLKKYWRGFPLSGAPSRRSCVYLQNKQLYDADCSLARYFICEKPLSTSCSSSPCQNYGSCSEGCLRYHCACPTGYYGERCEFTYNPCASWPCLNNGRCTKLISGYQCDCNEGSTGVRCEEAIPNELSYNCSNWIPESQTITCECRAKGDDSKARVGWNLSGDDADLKPTIVFESLERNTNLSEYVCQMKQVNSSVADPVVRNITYRPRIAYGPSGARIAGPATVRIDNSMSIENVILSCLSVGAVMPFADRSWTGVQCLEGKFGSVCTFQPDLEWAILNRNVIPVRCTVTNGGVYQFHKSATHNVVIDWSGRARVVYLGVEGVENVFAANTPNQRLTLVCRAFGRPHPRKLDVYLVAGRNSSATEGGDQLRPTKASNTSEYKLLKEYIVRSPAACDAMDTYRCETSNSVKDAVTDAKHITIVSSCTKRPKQSRARRDTATLSAIVGSFAGAIWALAGVVLTVYAANKYAAGRRTDGALAQQDATRDDEAQHETDMELVEGAEQIVKKYGYVSENHDDSMLADSSARTFTTYNSYVPDDPESSVRSTSV